MQLRTFFGHWKPRRSLANSEGGPFDSLSGLRLGMDWAAGWQLRLRSVERSQLDETPEGQRAEEPDERRLTAGSVAARFGCGATAAY